ncbi:MAG: GntR family transcriptional regulator [Actinomycetota bacterium]|nr:GntR family transcriptional regulator [Actinomycetota bacterium]
MAQLRRIEVVRINEQVYEAVEAAIVRCELEPGAVLGDRRLAEVLEVSRTPVRDALHRLESSGLVERRGRMGWMVSTFVLQDVRELFELRRILEPLGLERLSETWDEAVVRELSHSFEKFPERLTEDLLLDYLHDDHRFHKKIVECSRNGRVIRFYGTVEKQIDRIRHYLSYNYEGRVEASLKEHREICAAIAACDLSAATEALNDHLRDVEELITALARERGLDQRTRERSA